jgi:hypothetical protein
MKKGIIKKYVFLLCGLFMCLSAYSFDTYGNNEDDGNDDPWGCYGSNSAGYECDEIVVYPDDNDYDPPCYNLCFCYGICDDSPCYGDYCSCYGICNDGFGGTGGEGTGGSGGNPNPGTNPNPQPNPSCTGERCPICLGYKSISSDSDSSCPFCTCTPEKDKKRICNIYHGTVSAKYLRNSSNIFTPAQEQFIISLANLTALYELGYTRDNLKTDLINYPTNSSLYTKYNQLLHPERYIAGWASASNSSSGSDVAYVSSELGNSGLQLKYYPEKNGGHQALGLVKKNKDGGFNLFDPDTYKHEREAALEYLESLDVKYFGYPDDYLYDMHLYNALDFMNYYCQ